MSDRTFELYIIQLLKNILNLLKKKKKNPPKPITNLTARINNNMATATLTWVLPTQRTDGTPLATTDIGSITIFDVSTASPSHDQIGSVPGPATTFTTGTLTVGFHNFTVEVTDTTGHVSADSNVASVEVVATLASPNPPTNLVAVLNP